MSAPVRLPLIQGTPAWVDARHDFIGSSDLPVITGSSPFRTSRLELWAYKTRLLTPEPPDADTQEMWDLGHLLEDDIATRYTAITDRSVRRANRMIMHPTIRWASASLDRVSARKGERRIIEIKWAPHRRFGDGPEPVPANVQDQVQWQLMVSGYDVADVAVLAGSKVSVHEVGPDDKYQADLLYLARDFRGYVERGERPPIDGSEATTRIISRLHPRDTLGFREPSAELAALAQAERVAAKAKDAAKGEHDRLRNVIRAVLSEHAGAEDQGWRITYRKSADSTVVTTDWRAVASAYRSLVEGRLASTEALAAIESLHTVTETKEGARPLIVRTRDEETNKWS